jgi:hypothetical protein
VGTPKRGIVPEGYVEGLPLLLFDVEMGERSGVDD